MIKLEDLKKLIELNSVDDKLIIFKCLDNTFIAEQYIHEISKFRKLDLYTTEEIKPNLDIFGMVNNISIYRCDKLSLDYAPEKLNNNYIICKSIDSKNKYDLDNYVVEIPKLENWQVEDYIISNSCDNKYIRDIIKKCNYNIYRLDTELKKIKNLGITENNILQVYNSIRDVSEYSIFDITNAIIKRDKQSLSKIFEELEVMDVEPMGVITLLYKNFKNIILVQLGKNPTAESCNMNSKQFWAIKHNCNYYSKEELVNAFMLITDMDRKIKTGEIDINIVLDYLITQIL